MMAFPGHQRSLALTCTSFTNDSIGNVHPDRHRHIELEQSSPKRPPNTVSKRTKHFSAQQDPSQDVNEHVNTKDSLTGKYRFRNSIALGTDDTGNAPTASLWVGNVPSDLTNEQLGSAFDKYGPILSVRATPAKHCGFVNFVDIDAAIRAWHDCHERDVFGTGAVVYVRYETPPSWLRERNSSLKRKRPSVEAFGSFAQDLKKPIPTGPRSQTTRGTSQDDLRLQQTCVSPPPFRRYDTYRPDGQLDEDYAAKTNGERHGRFDTYRPPYDGNNDNDDQTTDNGDSVNRQANKRKSFSNSENCSPRFRFQIPNKPADNPQPLNGHQKEPMGLSVSQTRRSGRESPVLSQGMGIKGLAASRKVSSGVAKDSSGARQSGLQIKGAATQNKVFPQHIPGPASRNVVTPRNSDISEHPHITAKSAQRLDLSSHAQKTDLRLTGAYELAMKRQDRVDSTVPSTSSSGLADREKDLCEPDSKMLIHSVETEKPLVDAAISIEKLGFAHLSHLFEVREKENFATKKARTISPFTRARASSRETSSVKSAKTDPTPVYKPPDPGSEVCEKCNIGGSFLRLFKCSVASCSRKFHSICGNLSSEVYNGSMRKTKFVCDQCLEEGNHAHATLPNTKSTTKLHTRSTKTNHVNGCSEWRYAEQELRPLSVNTMSLKDAMLSTTHTASIEPSRNGVINSDLATAISIGQASSAAQTFPEKTSDLKDYVNGQQHATPAAAKPKTLITSPTQLKCPPPKEPRSMRNGEVNSDPRRITSRYKNDVTCPWWKKGNKCVRRAEHCMFAHRHTGIESPSGRSPAKDWTCFDFGTTLGCRFPEKECLYSHRDTGLYVGLDGKASKKHLECYWWHHHGRCRFSDSECTCAHFTTGLVAEEPMPRDTVRHEHSQTSVPSIQGIDGAESSYERSPSYSPPPPSTTEQSVTYDLPYFLPIEQPLPLDVHGSATANKTQSVRVTDTTDPRLRRSTHGEANTERPTGLVPAEEPAQSAILEVYRPLQSVHGSGINGNGHVEVTPSRQSSMNKCKICSKLVFRTDTCTDCQKGSQRRGSEQISLVSHATDQEELEVTNMESKATAPTFATPAPKILKRTRSGSSSNMFASKRQRPNIMTSRSNTSETPTIGSSMKPANPPTLEQLNRQNAERRASNNEPTDYNSEQDLPKPDLTGKRDPHDTRIAYTTNDMYNWAQNFVSKASSPSPAEITESPVDLIQPSLSLVGKAWKPKQTTIDTSQYPKHAETLREAYGEPERPESRSESAASDDDDSDRPLAELRHREEKPFWSSSTSTTSPQQPRVSSKAATASHQRVRRLVNVAFGPSTRCRTCVKFHRKCVHDTRGEYDSRKCFEWQQERDAIGVKQKTHYTESERIAIKEVAREYEASVQESNDGIDPLAVDETSPAISTQAQTNAYQDRDVEIHEVRRKQSPMTKVQVGKVSRAGRNDPPYEVSQSLGPQKRQNIDLLDFHVPSKVEIPTQPKDIAGIIARLKARGVVFEDSDSDDESTDDHHQTIIDERIDPLLRHKQKHSSPMPPLKLPKITKGQGLKFPQLIHRRQMSRNSQLFGNPHKEVDRRLPQQDVSAMIQKKNLDDLLAVPQEVEETMTFQEFLGFQQGQEVEACLGKVSLPRGKASMELAFRERDVEPGLGAWGRERRGTRREKPVFVIGL